MEDWMTKVLAEFGLRARWRHDRIYTPITPVLMTTGDFARTGTVLPHGCWKLEPCGGQTTCVLVDKDGAVVATGFSICHPRDHFNKSIGRTKSTGRAVGALRRAADMADRDKALTEAFTTGPLGSTAIPVHPVHPA